MTGAEPPLGLIVAAPRSGAGKTTVALGLMRALSRKDLAVQPFKCGPDYIDPAFHACATGRPSCNLDSWAMTGETIARLVARCCAGSDIAIAEGVMGLFDGAAGPGLGGNGATADIAALLGWPVILVLDVSGQTETAAAVALGCARYREDVTVAGVILNRVASERHVSLIRPAFANIGLDVLGTLARNEQFTLPERHLGLVQAMEHAQLAEHLDALGEAVAQSVDLDAVIAAARRARALVHRSKRRLQPEFGKIDAKQEARALAHERSECVSALERFPEKWDPVFCEKARPDKNAELFSTSIEAGNALSDAASLPAAPHLAPPGQRIALAQDRAFSFIYPHVLQGWRDAGAEIVAFSPLADEPPDGAADAIWLPGGYPELHAGCLAAAAAFRQGMRHHAARGTPIHGECGGYMVLGDGLEDADGAPHAMLGLLSVETSFRQRRLNLGYRRARLLASCPLGAAGGIIFGHEFHYATMLRNSDAPLVACSDAGGGAIEESGARRANVTGTFFHAIGMADPARGDALASRGALDPARSR